MLSLQRHVYFPAKLFSTGQLFLIWDVNLNGMGLWIDSNVPSMLVHNGPYEVQ